MFIKKIKNKIKKSPKNLPIIIPVLIVVIPLLLIGVSWIFQLLWNWLMPEIFGLIEITIWQAAGILLFGRFIFGSFLGEKSSSTKKEVSFKVNNEKFFNWWKEEGADFYKQYKSKNNKEKEIEQE